MNFSPRAGNPGLPRRRRRAPEKPGRPSPVLIPECKVIRLSPSEGFDPAVQEILYGEDHISIHDP